MASSATGLDKGIKILSYLNMVAAILLMGLAMSMVGLTDVMASFVRNSIDYLIALPRLLFDPNPFNAEQGWRSGWTLIYLVWWVAWTPLSASSLHASVEDAPSVSSSGEYSWCRRFSLCSGSARLETSG